MNERPDIIADLKEYSTEIANWRVEALEKYMRESPGKFPGYVQALEDVKREKAALIQKLGGDIFALEALQTAWIMYHGELVFEAYRQGVLDGGRIYQAFAEHELPRKESAE